MRFKAKHFASLIKQKRESYPMTQAEAEKKIFETRAKFGQYWSNIERGQCTMPAKHLGKTADILEIPINELIDAYILDFREAVLFEMSK